MSQNSLIYGKDPVKRIVSSEVKDDYIVNYIADGNDTITEKRDFYYYVLMDTWDNSVECGRLGGKNTFQYFAKFTDKQEVYQYCRALDNRGVKHWRCYNPVESAMLREGFTYYKDMTVNDVSVLSFDIETTGVTIDENSYVLLISNTYRSRSGDVVKRLFAFDDYDSPRDFIDDWCKWVRGIDPDIMVGHNIFAFDLPYLAKFAKLQKTKLRLGRNASAIKFDRNPRRFRKDGSQSYDYNNAHIFGREIVDTFFLAIKYDVKRNYPSYGLKPIIAHEGLEKEGRQHWDFSKNKEPWSNPADWAKFKQYAEDDADDALALFDLMIPQFFYYAQMIPKSFQEIINTASGSQINSLMVRSYLQDSEAIPMADEKEPFQGAKSYGIAGRYKNVFGLDFKSMYPTIIIAFDVHDPRKDPKKHVIVMCQAFIDLREKFKKLYKETGEEKYNGMQEGVKVAGNSVYGFMGAPGLNFNFMEGAAFITEKGRHYLDQVCKKITGVPLERWINV